MDGQQHRVEVEALNPEVHALHQAQAAAVKQQSHQTVGRLQLAEDGLGLGVGEDDGNVAVAFGANHAIELAELAAQDVAVEEQQGVKRLVLGGGGHAVSHRQLGEKATHLLAAELVSGPAANKSLKLPHPEAISSQGFAGVVPELDSSLQVAVFLLPGGAPSRKRPRGAGWAGASGQAGVGRADEAARPGLAGSGRGWGVTGRGATGALAAWRGWGGRWALGALHREACARLRAPASSSPMA